MLFLDIVYTIIKSNTIEEYSNFENYILELIEDCETLVYCTLNENYEEMREFIDPSIIIRLE